MDIFKTYKNKLFMLFKINRKNNVNIWTKKVKVKFGRTPTVLMKVVTPEHRFRFFKAQYLFVLIVNDPREALELLFKLSDMRQKIEIKDLMDKDGFFYFNEKKVFIKDLYGVSEIPSWLITLNLSELESLKSR
jgi:hypothetical protein